MARLLPTTRAEAGTRSDPLRAERASHWPLTVTLLAMLGTILASVLTLTPPAALPADAPATQFSAGRALAQLHDLAQQPRPVGSAENARVRAAIVAQLDALGLAPEVQRTSSTAASELPGGSIVTTAEVQNIVARIRGSGAGQAIALIAHYDSVKTTPGAFDNGAGVAALLETTRALTAAPPLRNDIILLFTDAEEIGRLGANAFVAEHPWAADVALALNVDAAGANGPVVLFETSAANGALLDGYAAAAPRPATSSLLPSLYRLLPNDTDLTAFLRQGVAGMNFAFADANAGYHAGSDTVARLDPRSLQHQGANLLALARHFGMQDLGALAADDAIFFTLPGLGVVRYPQGWAVPLAMFATTGLLGVIVAGVWRRVLTLRGVALGALATFGLAVGLAALGWLAVQSLARLRPAGLGVWNGSGGVYHVHAYELGLLVLLAAMGLLVTSLIQRLVRSADLLAGALLLWLALAGCTALLLPGGSYLFVWPLLAALPLLALQTRAGATTPVLLATLPSVVGTLLLAPALVFLLLLLKLEAAPALGLVTALLLGLLGALNLRPLARGWGWLAGLSGVATVWLIAVALLTPFSAERPRASHLAYSFDADRDQAAWFSLSQRPDPWTDTFLGEGPVVAPLREQYPAPVGFDLPIRVGAAPAAPLAAPTLAVRSDTTTRQTRTLRLHVAPTRAGAELVLLLEASDGISAVRLGERLEQFPALRQWFMRYRFGAPAAGEELEVAIRAGDTLHVRVAEISAGLPALPGHPLVPRPPELMPFETGLPPNEATIVQRALTVTPVDK